MTLGSVGSVLVSIMVFFRSSRLLDTVPSHRFDQICFIDPIQYGIQRLLERFDESGVKVSQQVVKSGGGMFLGRLGFDINRLYIHCFSRLIKASVSTVSFLKTGNPAGTLSRYTSQARIISPVALLNGNFCMYIYSPASVCTVRCRK